MIAKIRTWWTAANHAQRITGVLGVGFAGIMIYTLFSWIGMALPPIWLVTLLTIIGGIAGSMIFAGYKAKSSEMKGFGINAMAAVFYVVAGYYILRYLAWGGAAWMPPLVRIAWGVGSIAIATIGIGQVSQSLGGNPGKKMWLAVMGFTLLASVYTVIQAMTLTSFIDPMSGQFAVDAYEDIPALGLPQAKERMRLELGIAPGTEMARDFEENWHIKYRVAYWYLVPRGVLSMQRGFSILRDSTRIRLNPNRETPEGQRDEFFLWLCDKAGIQPSMNQEDMKRRIATAVMEYQKTGNVTVQPSVTETKLRGWVSAVASDTATLTEETSNVHTPFEDIIIRNTPGNRKYSIARNAIIIILLIFAGLMMMSKNSEKGGMVAILILSAVATYFGWLQAVGTEVLGSNSEYLKPVGDQPLIGAVVPQVDQVVPLGRLNTGSLAGTQFGPMAFTVTNTSLPMTTLSYWQDRAGWQGPAVGGQRLNFAEHGVVWVVPVENGDFPHEVRLDAGSGIIVWAPVCVLDDVLMKYSGQAEPAWMRARADNAREACRRHSGKPDMTEDDLRLSYGARVRKDLQ